MKNRGRVNISAVMAAFVLGFGIGGGSLYYAQAEGLFGLSTSVQQIGTTLADMKKNVDALQKNMATLTDVKNQLSALASPSGNPLLKEGESLKEEGDSFRKMLPGFNQ
jgi:hypothetical protein